jgi:hypothetical protein
MSTWRTSGWARRASAIDPCSERSTFAGEASSAMTRVTAGASVFASSPPPASRPACGTSALAGRGGRGWPEGLTRDRLKCTRHGDEGEGDLEPRAPLTRPAPATRAKRV